MNVLKNNYKTAYVEEIVFYPKDLVCEHCASELQYEEDDIEVGEFGCAFVRCPCCGRPTFIDDEEHALTLTVDNVIFPIHFHHTSEESGAVDCFDNETIKECIRKGIEYFRRYKDENHWFTAFGNMYISVNRWEGDEAYEVTVTNDYYITDIPFEKEDYPCNGMCR